MIEIATKEFIREWFWRRFKRSPDHNPMYFKEWLNRFDEYQGRSVKSYMDEDSRKYLDILIKERSPKMKTVIIITVEKEDHADAINENLAELERDGTLDFAFNVEIKKEVKDA